MKILYLMHIDWNWIKQRPQFIAEGLSDYFDIKVVYMASKQFIFKNPSNIATKEKLDIMPFFRMPLYENKWIYKLNKIYMRFYFKNLIKKYKPDFIWITFPQLYDYIPENTNCKLIYDCMDDAIRFGFKENIKSRIIELEKKLVADASLIFVSSNNLALKLIEREDCKHKISLLRNAFNGTIFENESFKPVKDYVNYEIGYVGLVSKWFDFETLNSTLKMHQNIKYQIFGPISNVNVKPYSNENMIFHGPIKHDEIYENIKDLDCLIMPFKTSELIYSVDPIKLYEYLSYDKPIISIFYEEIERFAPFVEFYSNEDELNFVIENMIKNGFKKKYSKSMRLKFLKSNTWDCRIKKIIHNLRELDK